MLASELCASYLVIVIQSLLKQHKVRDIMGSISLFDSLLFVCLSFKSPAIDYYFIRLQNVTEHLLIHQASFSPHATPDTILL